MGCVLTKDWDSMTNVKPVGYWPGKKKQHLNHGVSEQHSQKRKEKYLKDNETLYI